MLVEDGSNATNALLASTSILLVSSLSFILGKGLWALSLQAILPEESLAPSHLSFAQQLVQQAGGQRGQAALQPATGGHGSIHRV